MKDIRSLAISAIMLAFSPSLATATTIVVDPDAAADLQDISTFFSNITLSAINPGGLVEALHSNSAITGTRVFGQNVNGFDDDSWSRTKSPDFQAVFGFLASSVSIDYMADSGGSLYAYDSNNVLLGSSTSAADSGTFSVTALGNNIQYLTVVLNKSGGNDFGLLDHLVIETPASTVPEPSTFALCLWGGLGALAVWRRARPRPR